MLQAQLKAALSLKPSSENNLLIECLYHNENLMQYRRANGLFFLMASPIKYIARVRITFSSAQKYSLGINIVHQNRPAYA